MKIARTYRYFYLKLKRLRGNPKTLAGGTAIGVLIGLTPTLPLHTPLILLLTLMTRTSTAAAILVSWVICNPLTFYPIYYSAAKIGNLLTPYQLDYKKIAQFTDHIKNGLGIKQLSIHFFELGYEALVVLLVGGFAIAIPFGLFSYYLAHSFFVNHQKRRIPSI